MARILLLGLLIAAVLYLVYRLLAGKNMSVAVWILVSTVVILLLPVVYYVLTTN